VYKKIIICPLVIEHSYGKSPLSMQINGNIIKKQAIFHSQSFFMTKL